MFRTQSLPSSNSALIKIVQMMGKDVTGVLVVALARCFVTLCVCVYIHQPIVCSLPSLPDLSTVILHEHSNCPPTPPAHHWSLSSPPMTRQSILQHQRCRLPLFGRTIMRSVRWTMLEMTCCRCPPLSPTFSVYAPPPPTQPPMKSGSGVKAPIFVVLVNAPHIPLSGLLFSAHQVI